MKRAMLELNMSSGSLEILDRALSLARTLTELPFDLNLWQAQNLWYEILRKNGTALTTLGVDERPRWEADFDSLGICLGIDTEAIRADDELATASAAADWRFDSLPSPLASLDAVAFILTIELETKIGVPRFLPVHHPQMTHRSARYRPP